MARAELAAHYHEGELGGCSVDSLAGFREEINWDGLKLLGLRCRLL